MKRKLKRIFQYIGQSLDADYFPEGVEVVREKKDKAEILHTMPYVFLHIGCLAVFFVGWSWFVVIFALAFYVVRMFAITGFYHRYFSHKSYSASRPVQFMLAVIGNTAIQRGALWWAATHRKHHKHSDTEHDIHSPKQSGFLWSHIGWLVSEKNFPTDYSQVKDLTKFPELVFLNRFDKLIPAILGISLYITGFFLEKYFPQLGTNGGQLFIWGFFISSVILLHGTLFINSIAHVYGKQRFKTGDESRNSLLLALITLGEGWHNNHHHYANSARQGFYWWEIDITYYGLKLMSIFRIINNLKKVPKRIYTN